MASGQWSLDVEQQRCSDGSEVEQLLANLSGSSVTKSTSDELSHQLASLSSPLPLSPQQLELVIKVATELVNVAAKDIFVSPLIIKCA